MRRPTRLVAMHSRPDSPTILLDTETSVTVRPPAPTADAPRNCAPATPTPTAAGRPRRPSARAEPLIRALRASEAVAPHQSPTGKSDVMATGLRRPLAFGLTGLIVGVVVAAWSPPGPVLFLLTTTLVVAVNVLLLICGIRTPPKEQ